MKIIDDILNALYEWQCNHLSYPKQILLSRAKIQALQREACKREANIDNGYYIEGEKPPKFHFHDMEVVENGRDYIEFI